MKLDYFVYCPDCLASGSHSTDSSVAVAAWNVIAMMVESYSDA
jgi:hypothetical protein